MIWLHRFARLVAMATVLLIVAGGLVTSTGSGLSVPDWPTTYGWSMFGFPLSNMVGGIFYEHGHRLIATTVGCLTIVLAAWLGWSDPRRWVKWLGLIALVAVVAQGVLGGITVLFFLPAPVSIAHAGLAQIFLCLTVTLALVTSPGWRAGYGRSGLAPAVDDRTLRRLAVTAVGTVYSQILLGAAMRHTGAGLAIPDFPMAFGHLVPPHWSGPIAIHFAHRLGAISAALAVVAVASHVWYHHRRRRELTRPSALLVALVAVQITLGAFTVLTRKDVAVNTAHVATGALVLATSLVLALRAFRLRFEPAQDRVAKRQNVAVLTPHSSIGARA